MDAAFKNSEKEPRRRGRLCQFLSGARTSIASDLNISSFFFKKKEQKSHSREGPGAFMVKKNSTSSFIMCIMTEA